MAARLDPRIGLPAVGAGWLGGSLVVALLVGIVGDGRPTDELGIWTLAVVLAGGWVVMLAAAGWASRQGEGDLGLRARWIDLAGIPVGVATQLAVLPLLYAPLRAIWPDTFDDASLEENARDLVDRASGDRMAVLVAVVVIGAPFVEEVFYRGLLQSSLAGVEWPWRARVGTVVTVVVTAAVFALIHFRPVEYPGLFAIGLVLGVCTAATGRLGMAICAHVAFNATALVLVT